MAGLEVSPEDIALAALPARVGILTNGLAEQYQRDGQTPFTLQDGIAVIEISGVLVHRGAWIGRSSGQTSYEGIAAQLAGFDAPGLSLAQSLQRLLGTFVGEDGAPAAFAQDGMRLYLREMIEPTPVFAQAVGQHIGPVHEAIARLLARHIGVAAPDEDVHRLVFGLIAMAHDYCMSREFMNAVAPRLLEGPDALARARERLVDWAQALVAHERERRSLTNASP